MGEQAAADRFSDFCRRIHPELVGTLTLYTGDRETAHDLAQETLARMWKDWSRLERSDALRAYAYRAGLNLAKNRFRRMAVRRRYRHLFEADATASYDDVDRSQALAVRAAVASLPHRKRAALVLRYFADLSVAATAEAMDVPPNTVKSLTRRALIDLRPEFDTTIEEEADAH